MGRLPRLLLGVLALLLGLAMLAGIILLSRAEGVLQARTEGEPSLLAPTSSSTKSRVSSPTPRISTPTPPQSSQPGFTFTPLSSATYPATPSPTPTSTASLTPSLVLRVPSRTPQRCGPPSTWVNYTVQPGDTLYHLGQVYGIHYTEIQRANCLAGTTLYVGQHLYVPPWAPREPTATWLTFPTYAPPGETPSEAPTATATEILPPVDTSTPQPSETATP